MNTNKFFELCKEHQIDVAEVTSNKSKSFRFSIFKHELESYNISTSGSTTARGIYNGKLGACSTEKDDSTTPLYLIENIKNAAKYIEKEEEPIIFKGSEKYHKKNVYSKALEEWANEDKISKCFELEKLCYEKDSRIDTVSVSFAESSSELSMSNTYGLNLKSKKNYYYVMVELVVKEGEEVKSYYDYILSQKPEDFKVEEFATKLVHDALELLHCVAPKNGTYKAVLSQDTVSDLLNAFVSHASADDVQKHTSKFEGKLHEQVASKKITLLEEPLKKSLFFTYFDDEGVSTQNKTIVKNGVLETYLYNLETAKKDGVESTGNGYRGGGKIDTDFVCLTLKPGKLTEEGLFEKIKDGVYITGLNGIHSGLNAKSGDFSLQAEGFLVKDGKKSSPLSLFTVGGNLFDVFNNVIAVGNNSRLLINSFNLVSIAIKGLKVSA